MGYGRSNDREGWNIIRMKFHLSTSHWQHGAKSYFKSFSKIYYA